MIETHPYVLALQAADPVAARAAMDLALERGVAPERWVRDVVVPAQRLAGQRWFDGEWSVADEYAATAVAEQALALLPPSPLPPAAHRTVVFACAEGEWHSFPARLAAELSGAMGLRVAFLGASVSPARLSERLAAAPPDLLALSCTMATNLIGAWRSMQAARELGVPVAVGGSAWGPDSHRATVLGADLWLADPAELATVPLPACATAPPVELPAECFALEVPDRDLLRIALERQSAAAGPLSESDDEAALQGVTWLARYAAAAVATGDPRVVTELLAWQVALATTEGASAAVLVDRCHFLADAVERIAPLAAGVLHAEGDALRARSSDALGRAEA